MRIGVAHVQQETNTFSVTPTPIDAFTIRVGAAAADHTRGTNSEMGGAIEAIESAGHAAVPLVYAWALPSGRVTTPAFTELERMLTDAIDQARPLDGLVLALHGSMVADDADDADAVLIETARAVAEGVPVAISLDLHANVTRRMVAGADAIAAYHTDPHVDMGPAGARAARQLLGILDGTLQPVIALEKRPMIVPAESMNTTTGTLGPIRREADGETGVVDISLFPAQPWLDVAELGFGVLVTTNGDPDLARATAERYADRIWASRESFRVPRFLDPSAAIAEARNSSARPFIIAESADAPTAGAAGDSPAMVDALLRTGADLSAIVPVVDPAAVAACHRAGADSEIELNIGASIDTRWRNSVSLRVRVERVGSGTYLLTGAGYTGLEMSMGRFAVVASGRLRILLSELPAVTADPATFFHAGLDPLDVDVLVVRSCSDYRPNFPGSADEAVTLDVPGPATPRLENLSFSKAPRPLWPLDDFPDDL